MISVIGTAREHFEYSFGIVIHIVVKLGERIDKVVLDIFRNYVA